MGTPMLVISSGPKIHHNLFIQLGSLTITPFRTARDLGLVSDGQLSFIEHVASATHSCRLILYNISKIRPFLFELASQVLVLGSRPVQTGLLQCTPSQHNQTHSEVVLNLKANQAKVN